MAKSVMYYAERLGSPGVFRMLEPGYNPGPAGLDYLRRLTVEFAGEQDLAKGFFAGFDKDELKILLDDPPRDSKLTQIYCNFGILPLRSIRAVVRTDCNAADKLTATISSISKGNFDPDSELHRELVYSTNHGTLKLSYKEFKSLPWLEGTEVYLGGLAKIIEQTAIDSVEAFKFIISAAKTGDVVVGNETYGKQLAVLPIEDRLKAAGLNVQYNYVKSTDHDWYGGYYAADLGNLWQTLEDSPDVFVVDGTMNITCAGKSRFPCSTLGYIAAFEKTRPDYKLKFWAPEMGSEVIVGRSPYPSRQEGTPSLWLLQTATFHGSGGRLDDYRLYNPFIAGLDVTGAVVRQISPNVAALDEAIQKELRKTISKILD